MLLDRALPQDEAALRELTAACRFAARCWSSLTSRRRSARLVLAVARAEGAQVGYLPGLSTRRIADLHAGEAKTDARDAAIIARAARSMPHALRALRPDEENIAELALLSGFDDDLAKAITRPRIDCEAY